MPTITFSLKDLQNLVGKKLSLDEIKDLSSYGKGEFDGYDKETDEVAISFGDTNQPYLWSIEGVEWENTLIPLNSGWNLMGYPAINPQNTSIVLSAISGNYSMVMAYTPSGWKTFSPLFPEMSDLTQLSPGEGYWLNAENEVSLVS